MAIYVVDFEFYAPDGERPIPICVVSQEILSGKVTKKWLEGKEKPSCPYTIEESDLFISYYASAEIGCNLVLGWGIPNQIIDLFTEHRNLTNGLEIKNSLIDACEYWEAETGSVSYKKDMREIIIRGPPYSEEEQKEIITYCYEDVRLTASLYKKMKSRLDIPRSLLRGKYMTTIAKMEHRGIPIDINTLDRLKSHWETLQELLIAEVNQNYGVYDGKVFKTDLFERYLFEKGITWPKTSLGRLSLSDDTFKDMVKAHPELQKLKDLRYLLGKLRLNSLAIGSDGRNRCLLSPFRAKTGRNQPSTSKFIFGPAVWLRGLIKPEIGQALAYVDYSQQEFALAAYLSGDSNMIGAYECGDPYLAFAQMAGAAPQGATIQTHGDIRELYKVCSLGVQYGMREESLATQINKPIPYAVELIRHHKRTFKRFWEWSDEVLDAYSLAGHLSTSYGWQFKHNRLNDIRSNSVRNWPMQATGADILRLACVMLDDAGIQIIAPIHDAVLLESPLELVEQDVLTTQKIMESASRYVLGTSAFIRTDAEIIRYPDHFSDKRGRETWGIINQLLDDIDGENNT